MPVVSREAWATFGAVGITRSSVQLTGSTCPLLPIPHTWLLKVLEEILIWWKLNQWVCMSGGSGKSNYDFLYTDRNQGQLHHSELGKMTKQGQGQLQPPSVLPCAKAMHELYFTSSPDCHLAGRCRSSSTDQLLVHLCLSVSFSAFQGKMKCINVHKLPLMGCTSSIYTQALEV